MFTSERRVGAVEPCTRCGAPGSGRPTTSSGSHLSGTVASFLVSASKAGCVQWSELRKWTTYLRTSETGNGRVSCGRRLGENTAAKEEADDVPAGTAIGPRTHHSDRECSLSCPRIRVGCTEGLDSRVWRGYRRVRKWTACQQAGFEEGLFTLETSVCSFFGQTGDVDH